MRRPALDGEPSAAIGSPASAGAAPTARAGLADAGHAVITQMWHAAASACAIAKPPSRASTLPHASPHAIAADAALALCGEQVRAIIAAAAATGGVALALAAVSASFGVGTQHVACVLRCAAALRTWHDAAAALRSTLQDGCASAAAAAAAVVARGAEAAGVVVGGTGTGMAPAEPGDGCETDAARGDDTPTPQVRDGAPNPAPGAEGDEEAVRERRRAWDVAARACKRRSRRHTAVDNANAAGAAVAGTREAHAAISGRWRRGPLASRHASPSKHARL